MYKYIITVNGHFNISVIGCVPKQQFILLINNGGGLKFTMFLVLWYTYNNIYIAQM